jgi:hypothetical protein
MTDQRHPTESDGDGAVSSRIPKRTKRSLEEARAAFRAAVKHLSDPQVQRSIEAEAEQEMAKKRAELDAFLARSQEMGKDEFIR